MVKRETEKKRLKKRNKVKYTNNNNIAYVNRIELWIEVNYLMLCDFFIHISSTD